MSLFASISKKDFIKLHLQANRGTTKAEISRGLDYALNAFRSGERCSCGNPIWVIGSAIVGLRCFTCITGAAVPDKDYEIDEACGN